MVVPGSAAERFREKIDREMKSGLVALLLLFIIDRTGPEYGYRILRTIQETSHGRLAFKEGTAYPILANLERMGLVTSFWGDGASGPPRKYYQITAGGRQALGNTLADWQQQTAAVQRILKDLDEGPKPREAKT